MYRATAKNIEKKFKTSKKALKLRAQACQDGKRKAKGNRIKKLADFPQRIAIVKKESSLIESPEFIIDSTEAKESPNQAMKTFMASDIYLKAKRVSIKKLKAFFDQNSYSFTFEVFQEEFQLWRECQKKARRQFPIKGSKEQRNPQESVVAYEMSEEGDSLKSVRAVDKKVKRGSRQYLKALRRQFNEEDLKQTFSNNDYKLAHLYQNKSRDPYFKTVTEQNWRLVPDPVSFYAESMWKRVRYGQSVCRPRRHGQVLPRKRQFAFKPRRQGLVREIKEKEFRDWKFGGLYIRKTRNKRKLVMRPTGDKKKK